MFYTDLTWNSPVPVHESMYMSHHPLVISVATPRPTEVTSYLDGKTFLAFSHTSPVNKKKLTENPILNIKRP